MKHPRTAPLLLLALAGILATLALPGGRGGSVPPTAQESFAALVSDASREVPLTPEERDAHLERLRARGPQALARFLSEAVGADAQDGVRAVALESLETCATARELMALVVLALPGQGQPSRAVLASLRAAVVLTLERDPRGFEALVPAWQQVGSEQPELRAELIAAVAERGDPAGLEFLAWVATFETGAFDREVASACVPLAPRAWTAEERDALERVSVLLESADAGSIQILSGALASARLEAPIPAWIELLASDSRALRQRAQQALERVTGLALGADAARWSVWHASELAWAADEAPAVVAELASEEDARVLAALHKLGARRAGRDALAVEVTSALVHPSPAVRMHACATLERLGSTLVLAELAVALEDEDESVARSACSALCRLTGLDLAPEADAWNAPLARIRA
jgi:hypothetical protein